MKNPKKDGTYLCRLSNAFIYIAYYTNGKWIEMWGKKELEVVAYMAVPQQMKENE